MRHTLGIPCPGCGLSRAVGALLHGDVEASLKFHAFAPIFLISLILIGAVWVLPTVPRQRIIRWTRLFELKTGLVAVGLMGLMVYWLARLVWGGESYTQLIMGG